MKNYKNDDNKKNKQKKKRIFSSSFLTHNEIQFIKKKKTNRNNLIYSPINIRFTNF